jgi:WD repeat-containing protein 68
VYDVDWLPGSTDIFVSVGADGSLRAFDLRSLEHSTILYETPAPKNPAVPETLNSTNRPGTSPLLRIKFHPTDSNYMATFHMESSDVQILDMRSPGQPVIELRGHRKQVNAIGFGPGDQPLLATAGMAFIFSQYHRSRVLNHVSTGDDCQVLLWDLAPHTSGKAPPTSSRHGSSPRPDATKKRVVTEPVMAYTGASEISSLAWSPPALGLGQGAGAGAGGGEWLALAMGRTVKALQV